MKLFKKKSTRISINEVKRNILYSPVSGHQIPLVDVNDTVFSQKMMGDGTAIYPNSDLIYASVSGVISVVFPTKHVIGIKGEDGANVIIHMGIDTVELKGIGFDLEVKEGDYVNAGDLLAKIDLKLIEKKYDPTVIVIIENSNEYTLTHNLESEIQAGDEIMSLEVNQ